MTKPFVLTDAQATAIHEDNAVRLCLIAYVQCPTDKTAVDVVKAVAAHVRAEPLIVKPINVEFITAAKQLLTIATSAAYKIKVEQNRGAGYMHSEVDWLVQCNPAIRAWLVKTGWGGQIYQAPTVEQIDALDFSLTLLKGQPL